MTTKPDMTIAWAQGAAAPDIVPPDNTKLDLGWLGEDLPPHNYFNFQQNRADEYLKHLDENGVPVWDTSTIFSIGSISKGSDAVVYRSKTNTNQNNDPSGGGDPTNWEVWVPPAASTAEVIAGTEPEKYVSPFTFEQGLAAKDLPDLVRVPVNISPVDTAIDIANPVLIGSDYAAVYGVLQKSAQFQVATDALMASIIYDSGELVATVQHTVPGGNLSGSTQYYWWVRYRSIEDVWSGYSLVTSFTTAVTLYYIEQPAIVFPADDDIDVTQQLTVTSSAFTVNGGVDTHITSRWQISLNPSFASILYDSGNTIDLVSHTLPQGTLSGDIEYFVRVLYTGSILGSTPFSAANSFTTKAVAFDWSIWDSTNDGLQTTIGAGGYFGGSGAALFGDNLIAVVNYAGSLLRLVNTVGTSPTGYASMATGITGSAVDKVSCGVTKFSDTELLITENDSGAVHFIRLDATLTNLTLVDSSGVGFASNIGKTFIMPNGFSFLTPGTSEIRGDVWDSVTDTFTGAVDITTVPTTTKDHGDAVQLSDGSVITFVDDTNRPRLYKFNLTGSIPVQEAYHDIFTDLSYPNSAASGATDAWRIFNLSSDHVMIVYKNVSNQMTAAVFDSDLTEVVAQTTVLTGYLAGMRGCSLDATKVFIGGRDNNSTTNYRNMILEYDAGGGTINIVQSLLNTNVTPNDATLGTTETFAVLVSGGRVASSVEDSDIIIHNAEV